MTAGTIHVRLVCALLLTAGATVSSSRASIRAPGLKDDTCILQPTMSGYLPLSLHPDDDRGKDEGDSLFFAYFERMHTPAEDEGEAPILLWLQGGPGCASSFGLFYELGPHWVNEKLCLDPNPGAWTHFSGLLIIDQPLGTGLSFVANTSHIPRDEIGMATHLYIALQQIFTRYSRLQQRPLFITGESYGGKYVPSMAHYILQVQQQHVLSAAHSGQQPQQGPGLQHLRRLPDDLPRPLFKLAGIAVGNGLTSPREQTLQLALTAKWAGIMDTATAADMQARVQQVVSLIDREQWVEAHTVREDLRANITALGGIATMFDTRRTADYDPHQLVDKYLNNMDVRDALRAKRQGTYASCNDDVGAAMAGDVMQSVAHLVPDLLQHIPVLFYQGQFDILDGPASNSHWLEAMEWPLKQHFNAQPSTLWECPGGCQEPTPNSNRATGMHAVAKHGLGAWHGNSSAHIGGWQRSAGLLTHAVVYRAGHMVPRDQPIAMRHLLETWITQAMGNSRKAAA